MKTFLYILTGVLILSCNPFKSDNDRLNDLMEESTSLNVEVDGLKSKSDKIYAHILDPVPASMRSDAYVVLGQHKSEMAISQDSWGDWDGAISLGASIMNMFQNSERLEEIEELMRDDMEALKAIKIEHDNKIERQDEVIVASLNMIHDQPDLLGDEGNRNYIKSVNAHYARQGWQKTGGVKGILLSAVVNDLFSTNNAHSNSSCPVCSELPPHARISCLKCGGDGYLD